MQTPSIPANETDRLRALESYQLLDTPNEEAFDDIAKVAAFVMQVPIALVSLVDDHREWFKAQVGLAVRASSRELSFCGHVVGNDASLVVRDALTDSRFADHPAVTGEAPVRFYAGMPLRTEDGYVLGSLCAIDHVPRNPTSEQLEVLALLAKQVVRLFEKRRLRSRLEAEHKEIAAANFRLQSVFDVMAEGIVVQDSNGAIVSNNDAAERILSLSGNQMRGRTSIDPRWRAVREDGSPFPGAEHPAMRTLRSGLRESNVVMGIYTATGELHWISINSAPSQVTGSTVNEVVTTFHDITKLKAAAERLSQAQRLATTGTLVAGIGHEINNPLAFVIGNLDLAIDELRSLAGPSPSSRLRELNDVLSEARLGADRIRKIVRGLRALARDDFELQAVALDTVIETSLSMAQHEIRRKASVSIAIEGLPAVLGDESRLTQVLVNLLVNAGQAFETANPETNRIMVSAVMIDEHWIRLSIADNGPGIPPDLAARVFDPFFTTKAVGQGTGLGLAVSRGIIDAIGGRLQLEAQEGTGAIFHIDLRVAKNNIHDIAKAVPVVGGVRGRILLIDDDVPVLNSLRRSLVREHEVTALSDPREALQLLRTGPKFDVIFCDLMMPYLTGQELYEAVREVQPELAQRMVFVTGGATTAAARLFFDQLPNDVLEKPFGMSELLAIARRYTLRRVGA